MGIAAGLTAFAVLTKSRTSCAGLLAAAAGVGVFAASGRAKLLLGLFAAGGAAAAAVALMLVGADPTDDARRAALMGREGQSGTLSGRLEIWEALHPYAVERKWLGFGYGAFWNEQRVYALQSEVDLKFSASHSAWYEAVLTGGLPLAGLLAAVLLGGLARAGTAGMRRAVTRTDPLPAFAFGVLILAILNSLSEAIVADVRLTPFLMLCALLKLTFLPDSTATTPARSRPARSP